MAAGFGDSWVGAGDRRGGGRRRNGPFEDIVDERRQQGDLGWVLRTRHDVPRPAFCAVASPEAGASGDGAASGELKRQVLQSDRLTSGLRDVALETGRSLAELTKEAEAVLDEMAHSLNMFSIRSFGFAVSKVMKRLYRGVYVNSEGIAQLRKASSEYPVILMPMHRSYADFLLLSLICFDYDLPLPAIASAMDFMGMRFIGTVLRNCGAFFIRRSFASDRVYWMTFVEYVKTHVRDGLHPVEFFIEGTRSRSGKSLYPKTGMLGAILESWFMCEVPDVYLVPVSISYDRILEEKLYAYELLGVPKPKESTGGLLKARALLAEDYGNVHFFFDEPISLRRFAASHGGVDRSVHSLAPKVKAQLTEAESLMLKAAAHHVVSRHCANAVVSPFCLIAGLLLATPARTPLLPAAALSEDLAWLRRHLADTWGVRIDWPAGPDGEPDRVLADQCRLHSDIVSAAADGGDVSLADPDPTTEPKAAELSAAAAGLRLASYRNQLMCHLAGPALSLVAARLSADDADATYEALRRLMHREFPTLPEQRPNDHPATVDAAGDPRLSGFLLASLRPFLAGYWALCDSVLAGARDPPAAASDRQVALAAQAASLARLANVGSLGIGGGAWLGWDCVSLDLLGNAVHGLHRLRLLARRSGEAEGARPLDFDREGVRRLARMLESIIELTLDTTLTTPSSGEQQRSKL